MRPGGLKLLSGGHKAPICGLAQMPLSLSLSQVHLLLAEVMRPRSQVYGGLWEDEACTCMAWQTHASKFSVFVRAHTAWSADCCPYSNCFRTTYFEFRSCWCAGSGMVACSVLSIATFLCEKYLYSINILAKVGKTIVFFT